MGIFFHFLLDLLWVISNLLSIGKKHEQTAVLSACRQRKKKILDKRAPLNGGSVSIQSSMPPHQAHGVRAIPGHRDCGVLTISLRVGYLHRRFRWYLVSHRHKKGVSQPNGYVTAAGCEVIHELLAAMTSSAVICWLERALNWRGLSSEMALCQFAHHIPFPENIARRRSALSVRWERTASELLTWLVEERQQERRTQRARRVWARVVGRLWKGRAKWVRTWWELDCSMYEYGCWLTCK